MTTKSKRSEEMTKEEYREFLRYVFSFPTKTDAAAVLGVSRPTLYSLINHGIGDSMTIDKIRETINHKAA